MDIQLLTGGRSMFVLILEALVTGAAFVATWLVLVSYRRRQVVKLDGPGKSSSDSTELRKLVPRYRYVKVSPRNATYADVTTPRRHPRLPQPDGSLSSLPTPSSAVDASHLGASAQAAHAQKQLLQTLRNCAADHRYHDALIAHDRAIDLIGDGCCHIWSVLLYVALEAGELDRCDPCFEALCAQMAVSSHDFVNMVRVHVRRHDLPSLKRMLIDRFDSGNSIDIIARNRALVACVNEDALDFADALMDEGTCFSEELDTMKDYPRVGELSRSYGILLDACVGANDMNRARQLFQELRNSNVWPNADHFTTMIKGLVDVGRFDEASSVLSEMLHTPSAKPDLSTYSMVIRAYADNGDVKATLGLLEQMAEQGIKPDEIVCNSVLTSCCVSAIPLEVANVLRILDLLVTCGGHPTTSTLSILLKALVRKEQWAFALEALEAAPSRFGTWAEPRLYARLAYACIKGGDCKMLLEIYDAMVNATRDQCKEMDRATNSRLLCQCATCGNFDMAAGLHRAILDAGGSVEPRVISMVRCSAKQMGTSMGFAGIEEEQRHDLKVVSLRGSLVNFSATRKPNWAQKSCLHAVRKRMPQGAH